MPISPCNDREGWRRDVLSFHYSAYYYHPLIFACYHRPLTAKCIRVSYFLVTISFQPIHNHPFLASFLHSLIMGWTILILSLHMLEMPFFRVLSVFALTYLILMPLFWESVFLFKFLLNYVHVITCEISLACCLMYPYGCLSSNFCFLNFLFLFFNSSLSYLFWLLKSIFICFFCILFESKNRCICVILKAGKPSFFISFSCFLHQFFLSTSLSGNNTCLSIDK